MLDFATHPTVCRNVRIRASPITNPSKSFASFTLWSFFIAFDTPCSRKYISSCEKNCVWTNLQVIHPVFTSGLVAWRGFLLSTYVDVQYFQRTILRREKWELTMEATCNIILLRAQGIASISTSHSLTPFLNVWQLPFIISGDRASRVLGKIVANFHDIQSQWPFTHGVWISKLLLVLVKTLRVVYILLD